MENTLENKVKFFALYYGQNVLQDFNNDGLLFSYPINHSNMYRIEESILELKSLESISDIDSIKIAEIENDCVDTLMRGKNLIKWFYRDISSDFHCVNMRLKTMLEMCDYLRSKGYALPWMGLSVEKLIEYGWIKLK